MSKNHVEGIRRGLVIPMNHQITGCYGTTMTPCTVVSGISHFNKLHRMEIINMNIESILELTVEADEIL